MILVTSGKILVSLVADLSNEDLAYATVCSRGSLKSRRYSSLLAALADARSDEWVTARLGFDLLVEVAPGRLASLDHILWAIGASRYKRVSENRWETVFGFYSVATTGFGDILEVRLAEDDDAEMPSQSSRVVSRRAA